MKAYALTKGEYGRRPDTSTWIIGTVEGGEAIFPTNERMTELFAQSLPGAGELIVLNERNGPDNHVMVEIPKGIKPWQRQPFIEALSKEVQPV